MRIAVTGGTGFVGGAVVRGLAARGHSVLALGRSAAGPDAVEYARWDLGLDDPPPVGLSSCDAVVHAAAHVAAWGDEQEFHAVTVTGTARVLDAMDPGARLVVIGSSSVYVPDGRRGSYRESDAPLEPRRYLGPYPRAKAAQERLVAARRPDAIILRPRAVWGPGDRTLLPRIESRVRSGRLVLPDGGRHRMSTTHIESLTTAVVAALEHPEVRGPVNVADATPRSPRELLVALFAARNEPLRIVGVPGRLADGAAFALESTYRLAGTRREPPITRYAISALVAPVMLDLARLHAELGIRPDVNLVLKAEQLAGT
ncbi:MAG: NAD-dependent epimerase/dehydratase family protein [Chloroflexota bacterium]